MYPVLDYTARLRILYYFVKINQSFNQEIKSYIKKYAFACPCTACGCTLPKYHLQATSDEKRERTWGILLAVDHR